MISRAAAKPLKQIFDRLQQIAPLSVSAYMQICLTDPNFGYYTTKDPLNSDGDFITAPEASQLFGELIGLFYLDLWHHLGRPAPFTLIECGPGRGTLMNDFLRAIKQIDPSFIEAMQLVLVETSPVLRKVQAETLTDYTPRWIDLFDPLPDCPKLIIGNEFLDVLPIDQYIYVDHAWRQRLIDTKDNQLVFVTGNKIDHPDLPPSAEDGDIFEICPLAPKVLDWLGNNVEAALFIDYASEPTGHGDTLQALLSHQKVDPLKTPGQADLTTHVRFDPLTGYIQDKGFMAYPLTTQKQFLQALGIEQRFKTLLAQATPDQQRILTNGYKRITSHDQMGDLFKVWVYTRSGKINPAGVT